MFNGAQATPFHLQKSYGLKYIDKDKTRNF